MATSNSNLKRHLQTQHVGFRFPCNQCEHQATTKKRLKIHHDNEHDGVRYTCDQCDFKSKRMQHLQKHKQNMHSHSQSVVQETSEGGTAAVFVINTDFNTETRSVYE